MRARLAVYDPRGTTFRGYLPTVGLQFSEEIGSGGNISYTALKSEVDAVGGFDCVLVVELETPGGWVPGPSYAIRHNYNHQGGSRRFEFTGRSLLEEWGEDAVLLPEYVNGTMPRRGGRERGVGWMMTSYNPATDPNEDWDACYNTDRDLLPDDWPIAATDAKWISASGATSETESKFFRAWITITGTAKRLVRFWFSSDESATLWCAGERVAVTNSVEIGKKSVADQTMVLYPGTYAVGVFTATHFSKGGDGIDPVIVAAAIVNDEGDPSSWVLKSTASGGAWKACRRDNEPPNDYPPGPTPGAALIDILDEAKARDCSGWAGVTYGFSATHDSYGVPWGDEVMVERLFSYGHDTYWGIFQSLAESDDVDVWMRGLTLHAAPRQGQSKSVTLTTEHLRTFSTHGTDNNRGNWALAEYNDGWYYKKGSGIAATGRREFMLEVGQALTNPVVSRVARASMKDSWRWDGTGSLNPPQPGWIPYVDLSIGDWVPIDYQAVEYDSVVITSWSARAGEGGLLWDIEVTEFLPRLGPESGSLAVAASRSAIEAAEEPPAEPPAEPTGGGMFS